MRHRPEIQARKGLSCVPVQEGYDPCIEPPRFLLNSANPNRKSVSRSKVKNIPDGIVSVFV